MRKLSIIILITLLQSSSLLLSSGNEDDASIYHLENSHVHSENYDTVVHHNKILFLGEENQQHDFNNDGDRHDVVCFIQDHFQRRTHNLKWVTDRGIGFKVQPDGPWAAVRVYEDFHRDLNGDGDQSDYVHHLVHVHSRVEVNLGLAGYQNAFAGDCYFFNVDESQHAGSDLNSDGDSDDHIFTFFTI